MGFLKDVAGAAGKAAGSTIGDGAKKAGHMYGEEAAKGLFAPYKQMFGFIKKLAGKGDDVPKSNMQQSKDASEITKTINHMKKEKADAAAFSAYFDSIDVPQNPAVAAGLADVIYSYLEFDYECENWDMSSVWAQFLVRICDASKNVTGFDRVGASHLESVLEKAKKKFSDAFGLDD